MRLTNPRFKHTLIPLLTIHDQRESKAHHYFTHRVQFIQPFVSKILLLCVMPFFLACNTPSDNSNKQTKHFLPQYPATHIIQYAKNLKRGMSKAEVKRILGQPYYSPLKGLYYYPWKDSKSLVLDYRNQQDDITKTLQSFWIAKIGE